MSRDMRIAARQPKIKRIASAALLQRDVPVPMSDGMRLMVNVFCSSELLSVTPCGKDVLPDRRGMLLMRLAGVRFGHLDLFRVDRI